MTQQNADSVRVRPVKHRVDKHGIYDMVESSKLSSCRISCHCGWYTAPWKRMVDAVDDWGRHMRSIGQLDNAAHIDSSGATK